MNKNRQVKRIVKCLLIVLLFTIQAAFGQNEYIREINYKFGDGETQTDARSNATNEIKRILSDELGGYIVSQTSMQRSETDNKYNERFEQTTKNASLSYMKVFILEEEFTTRNLYLKVKIEVDESKLQQNLEQEGFSGKSDLLATVFSLMLQNNVGMSDVLTIKNTDMVLANMQSLEQKESGVRVLNVTKASNGQILDGTAVLTGLFQVIYTNGNTATFTLENSLLNGQYRCVDNQGSVISEGEFQKGRKHGNWKQYDLDRGDWYLKSTEQYSNGFLDGLVIVYGGYDLRTKLEKTVYKQGIPVLKTYYDNDGTYYEGPVNKLGNKTGEWITKSADGTTLAKVNYANDKKDGPAVAYYRNGKVEHECSYRNDINVGWYTSYFENGQVEVKKEYEEDGISSYNYEKYLSTGQLLMSIKVQDNKFIKTLNYWENGNLKGEKTTDLQEHLAGPQKLYFENGKLQSDENYTNGLKSGLCIYYNNDGSKKQVSNFKLVDNKSVRHGEYQLFNFNGVCLKECWYNNDKLNGLCKEFYDSGSIKKEANYKMDEYNGDVKEYFEDGLLKNHEIYTNGVRTGEWIEVSSTGDKFYKAYENNLMVNEKRVLKDGRVFETSYPTNGDLAKHTEYDAAGNIIERSYYEGYSKDLKSASTKKEGKQISYYENGRIREERFWESGNLQGSSKSYFESGNLKDVQFNTKGKKDGIYASFSDTNGLLNVGIYKNNKKVDQWYSLKRDGSIEKIVYDDYGVKKNTETFTMESDVAQIKASIRKLLSGYLPAYEISIL